MTRLLSITGLASLGLLAGALSAACSSGADPGIVDANGDGIPDDQQGVGGDGTGGGFGVNTNQGTPSGDADNPGTCAEASSNRTYVGCEFWPTVTYNPLYENFDFAVVLANGGGVDAEVTVSGGGLVEPVTAIVPAGGLTPIALPWVAALKGGTFKNGDPAVDTQLTTGGRAKTSVRADGGAYRVVSSVPVTAWQFNPLQYAEAGVKCGTSFDGATDCFSVSNDASLLIPTPAMTGNYRVFSRSDVNAGDAYGSAASTFTVTATADATTVVLEYPAGCAAATNNGPGGCIAAGTGVEAASAGDQQTYTLNAGDVIQLTGEWGAGWDLAHADVSGTLINADKPVQVISLNPITNVPNAMTGNADHIEETVLPAEVIGSSYVVAAPTSPSGAVKGGHIVRIYGNVDGTNLTYAGSAPAGAPASINAGEVAEVGPVTAGFQVNGDQPFAVGSFMLGGAAQGSGACPDFPCSGDPAFSMMVAPEQFRTQYTFLAPNDYDTNFADVLMPDGAVVTIDGAPVTAGEVIAPGWSIARVPLGGETGAHRLESDVAVGLQVMGFGHATAYYYPGGLNLKLISEAVEIVVK